MGGAGGGVWFSLLEENKCLPNQLQLKSGSELENGCADQIKQSRCVLLSVSHWLECGCDASLIGLRLNGNIIYSGRLIPSHYF